MPRQEFDDEVGERLRVLVDAVERFLLVLSAQVTEARAGCVDEDQVAAVQKAELVIDDAIRRGGTVRIVHRHHALRTEGSHVQPDRGRTGAAVEYERERPVRVFLVTFEVGDIGHGHFRRLRDRLVCFLRRIVIQWVAQMHYQQAGFGLVHGLLAADGS